MIKPLQEDDENLAAEAHRFLETPYGLYVLEKLAALNYELHQGAEDAQTSEAKAFMVERAAGMRRAIELLTANSKLYEAEQEAARKANK